jgi:probable HAF family extracellular repeat protein
VTTEVLAAATVIKEADVKLRLECMTAVMLLAVVPLPVQLFAQSTRYKLIDLGTFGGPNSFVNGPTVPILSNNGTYAGEADTSIPDPFAPYCQNPDCLVRHAQKLRNGVVTDLGTLPGTNLSSGATWVSANGTIVGASENGLIDPLLGIPEIRAVLWTKDGQIIDLGTLDQGHESFAPAVNDRGQVAGWSLNTIPDPFSMVGLGYQTHGFLWQQGVRQDLGTLGGPDALPEAMNERGQIVGTSYTNSAPNPGTGIPTIDPFLWENGAMVDLGTLGGTVGVANFVNGRGQVVGTSNLVGDQTKHPFLWDRGLLKDLGTFGGSNGEALWISDSGLIVGRADLPGSQSHHAFLWKNGAMTDLGVVDPWPCSTAYSVNSEGQVVGDTGVCGVGGGPSFFSEHGEPIVDVNTLVLPGSDIEVTDAFDINDRGEIAGGGVLPNGDFHAVVLVPASAAEIAAASALPASSPTNAALLVSRPRTWSPNLFRRLRPEP